MDRQSTKRRPVRAALSEANEVRSTVFCLAIEVTQIDVQAPEAVQQRATRQAEFAGGEGLVAVVFAQAIEQQTAFHLFQAFAQVQAAAVFRHGFHAQGEMFGQ